MSDHNPAAAIEGASHLMIEFHHGIETFGPCTVREVADMTGLDHHTLTRTARHCVDWNMVRKTGRTGKYGAAIYEAIPVAEWGEKLRPVTDSERLDKLVIMFNAAQARDFDVRTSLQLVLEYGFKFDYLTRGDKRVPTTQGK